MNILNPDKSYIETMFGRDGKVPLWEWHYQRVFDSLVLIDQLEELSWLDQCISNLSFKGKNKIRLVYGMNQEKKFAYEITMEDIVDDYHFNNIHKLDIDSPIGTGLKSLNRDTYKTHSDSLKRDEEGLLVCENQILEGIISNVFIQVEGKWITPKFMNNMVGGVMRNVLLNHFQVEEKEISWETFLRQEDIFFSNALRGVILSNDEKFPSKEGAKKMRSMIDSLYFR